VNSKEKVHTVIFASGAGTLAEAIIEHSLNDSGLYTVCAIISNNSATGISGIASKYGIPFHHISTVLYPLYDDYVEALFRTLYLYEPRLLILAGYMKLIPKELINTKQWRILNTHPALLPKFGGKGMFGIHVHKKVIEKMEQISGLTVHRVSEEYDSGEIVSQEVVPVLEDDTPESLEARVKALEKIVYPKIINDESALILA